MGKYLARQIYELRLSYASVIAKFPEYKNAIDAELEKRGYKIDDDGNCVKQ